MELENLFPIINDEIAFAPSLTNKMVLTNDSVPVKGIYKGRYYSYTVQTGVLFGDDDIVFWAKRVKGDSVKDFPMIPLETETISSKSPSFATRANEKIVCNNICILQNLTRN